MADKKLSITIELEGGKEVEQQLEGIGKAGKKAWKDIEDAAKSAGGFEKFKPEEATAKLKAMGLAGTEAGNKIQAALQTAIRTEGMVNAVKKVEDGLFAVTRVASTLAGAFAPVTAAFAAFGALTSFLPNIAEMVRAINELDAAAIKLGKTFEAYDKQSQGMRSVGASAKAAAEGIQAIAEAADKAKLDRLTDAMRKLEVSDEFKKFQEDAARAKEAGGRAVPQLSPEGTRQLESIKKAATESGETGRTAREWLEKLGQPIPEGAVKSLKEINKEMGALAETMNTTGKAFSTEKASFEEWAKQIDAMPAGVERTKAVMDSFNNEFGVEMVKHLNAGGKAMDYLKEQSSGVTDQMVADATKIEESFNRSAAAVDNFKKTGDVSELGTVLTEMATRVGISFAQMGREIEAAMEKLKNAAKSLPTGAGGKTFETGAAVEFAGGGMVGGSGTGTSDSNLAWVSRGEHIMPARAVAQPGVLSLLESLRVSGGNLRGRFATGGVVALPEFARGGSVGGGMGHLGTVDLRTDHGSVTMMASPSAVEQLSRLAVTKRMTSTGRKPGFVSG